MGPFTTWTLRRVGCAEGPHPSSSTSSPSFLMALLSPSWLVGITALTAYFLGDFGANYLLRLDCLQRFTDFRQGPNLLRTFLEKLPSHPLDLAFVMQPSNGNVGVQQHHMV